MDLAWPSEGPLQGAFQVLHGESWASVYGLGMECGPLRIAQGLEENVGPEHLLFMASVFHPGWDRRVPIQ